MTHFPDPHGSVGHIRRRLFLLLVQAFGAVVLLTLVLLIAVVGLVLSNVSRFTSAFKPPTAYTLEAYYLARGSWEGVESLLRDIPESGESEWERGLLLDTAGRVLLDRGRADSPRVGQPYSPTQRDLLFPLQVRSASIGTLVFERRAGPGLLRVFVALLPPLVVISFFTGLLTLLIGLLLMRRMVTPLADVIAAAQSVAAGDLSTRVEVRGPGDLRSLSDSFNRMAGALERDDRERRAMLTDIAHELRTPLTIIRGKLEGVLDGVYPADEAHVAPVLEETYVLERLVEDLRLLTLAETRQLHFDRKPVDLGELAERAAGLFEAEASERGIAITVRVEPGLPPVFADPQRVGQVVGNLMSNALRYAPQNGRVEMAVQHSTDGVEFSVSDDGPGVPEADLPRLFDRFWRGEKSRTRAEGGAGLGLAIARQLVEAQRGTITAGHAPGGGLRVAVRLPVSS